MFLSLLVFIMVYFDLNNLLSFYTRSWYLSVQADSLTCLTPEPTKGRRWDRDRETHTERDRERGVRERGSHRNVFGEIGRPTRSRDSREGRTDSTSSSVTQVMSPLLHSPLAIDAPVLPSSTSSVESFPRLFPTVSGRRTFDHPSFPPPPRRHQWLHVVTSHGALVFRWTSFWE